MGGQKEKMVEAPYKSRRRHNNGAWPEIHSISSVISPGAKIAGPS
jgi:hypothetical protein